MRMKAYRMDETHMDEKDTLFDQCLQWRHRAEDLVHDDEEKGTETVLNTWFGRSFQIEEDDTNQKAQYDGDHNLRKE